MLFQFKIEVGRYRGILSISIQRSSQQQYKSKKYKNIMDPTRSYVVNLRWAKRFRIRCSNLLTSPPDWNPIELCQNEKIEWDNKWSRNQTNDKHQITVQFSLSVVFRSQCSQVVVDFKNEVSGSAHFGAPLSSCPGCCWVSFDFICNNPFVLRSKYEKNCFGMRFRMVLGM